MMQFQPNSPPRSPSPQQLLLLPFPTIPMAALLVSILVFALLTISTLSLSEQDALLKFKTSITHNRALDSWASGNKSPCEGWVGVICSGGKIQGLHLSSMALAGTIEIDPLLEIHSLRTVSFVNNNFSGPIPKFNRIGALKSMFLSRNKFSGEIPTDFFSHMLSLKKIWLNDNEFSGPIPGSLTRLSYLMELHLEGNRFSGHIPSIKTDKLTSLDMSRNKLTGEIPESLSGLSASVFAENGGLCGRPLSNECSDEDFKEPTAVEPDDVTESEQKADSGTKTAALVVMGLLFAGIVLVVLFSSKQRREDNFTVLAKERFVEPKLEPKLPPAAPKSIKNGGSEAVISRKGSKRGSHSGKVAPSDIVMVNDDKGAFGLSDLMKAAAEVLGNGALGSAYKAMMANGLSVVVKRMREMNAFTKEGFEAEMRRLGRLRHPNILTPLAYHYRREEKLLVSEHVPKGSLLYVLHGDRGMSHAELNWPTRYKIIRGIARGLGFLHTEFSNYDLPHGNLKSSNVLLGEDYEPMLSDYAFYPLMSSPQSAQAMFAFRAPDSSVRVSPKCDVYCLGIVVLEILTGKFPSQYLNNSKGGTDVVQWAMTTISEKREEEIIDPAIVGAAEKKSDIVKLLRLAAACTESDPEKRIGLTEAVRRIEELQV